MSEVKELTDEGMSTELAEERSSLQKRKASDISVPPDSSSSSSSSSDELSAVKLKMSAVEYCFVNFGSNVIPETEEKNFVKIYQKFSEDRLSRQLDYLQAKELELEKHRQAKEQNRQAMELELEKNRQAKEQNRQAMELELEKHRQAKEQNRQAMELELEKQKTLRMSSNSSSVVTGLNTEDKMIAYFNQEEHWSYSKATTVLAAFGSFKEFARADRESQMHEVWDKILSSNTESKCPAFYFHGSPGLGKTYLLRELFCKRDGDFAPNHAQVVKDLKIFVLDFNRNACFEAADFKDDFQELSNLFALSRLFYVSFAVQSEVHWVHFLRDAVVPLIHAGLTSSLEKLMIEQVKKVRGDSRCVILVDEVMKVRELGIDFADKVRSSVCCWMDKELCNTVLFSSLDVKFVIDERSTSHRPVITATTLPLFQLTASFEFLNKSITAEFVDDEGNVVDRGTVVEQLALVSGGHPRSLEYIVDICNGITQFEGSKNIKTVIDSAAERLCSAYNAVENWWHLFDIVLLAENVEKDAKLVGDNPTSETFRSLVTRGVLIDSFDEDAVRFMPTAPELFLYKWVLKGEDGDSHEEVRRFLKQILETRWRYTSDQFEIIHSSWEQLMRHVRQGKPKYAKVPLNTLYSVQLRPGAALAASCVVDGQSILKEIPYEKNTDIVLQPNTIYNPKDPNNPGFDRLIVLEAFPVSSEGESSQRFLLPLFIENKFSKDDASTKLSIETVTSKYNNCKEFLSRRMNLGSDFSFIPTDDNFILLFVAKCNTHNNAVADAPSNVMFCFDQDLERLYGPTLKGFVSSLRPGSCISVREPK